MQYKEHYERKLKDLEANIAIVKKAIEEDRDILSGGYVGAWDMAHEPSSYSLADLAPKPEPKMPEPKMPEGLFWVRVIGGQCPQLPIAVTENSIWLTNERGARCLSDLNRCYHWSLDRKVWHRFDDHTTPVSEEASK